MSYPQEMLSAAEISTTKFQLLITKGKNDAFYKVAEHAGLEADAALLDSIQSIYARTLQDFRCQVQEALPGKWRFSQKDETFLQAGKSWRLNFKKG